MNNLFSIAGKVAIVTGGSRGIGEMIARGFVENGARVYITARKAEECLATAERLSDRLLGILVPVTIILSISSLAKRLDAGRDRAAIAAEV